MLDRRLVEQVAEDLGTSPGLIEKDWHVVRALGVIAGVDTAGMMPAFSGGTPLSKGWELIKRFSEDIDFKAGEPVASSASRARRERTVYRQRVLEALAGAGFELVEEPLVWDVSRFFSANLAYGAEFEAGQGLRSHIRVEMSFQAPALPPSRGQFGRSSQQHNESCPKSPRSLVWIRRDGGRQTERARLAGPVARSDQAGRRSNHNPPSARPSRAGKARRLVTALSRAGARRSCG